MCTKGQRLKRCANLIYQGTCEKLRAVFPWFAIAINTGDSGNAQSRRAIDVGLKASNVLAVAANAAAAGAFLALAGGRNRSAFLS